MNSKDAYIRLAQKHGFDYSQTYLRVLRFLMTPEQAELVDLLPGTPEEISQKSGMPESQIKDHFTALNKKGVIVPKDYKTSNTYIFCKYAERLWEVSESLLGLEIYTDEEVGELFRLWDDWKNTDYADMTAQRWHNLKEAGIQALRIVPAYKSIVDSPEILPAEDVREIISVQPLISVVSCSCRRHMNMIGTPCKKTDLDPNCLQFAKSAEYSLYRGHGRKISVDEAMAIVDNNEEAGLVHQWMNHDKIEASQPYALCNCCRCCCTIWHYADIRQVPMDEIFAKSRYEARVDVDLCAGCEDCLDRCQFDAITMQDIPGHKASKAVVNPDKCWGCGVCTLVCPSDALKMHLVRAADHIPQATISPSQVVS